jgi:ribosomal protein L22
MADEKNTEKDQKKKPAARKPAAKKPAAKKKPAASAGAKKPAAKPKPKETATKGKGAAEATSKTADSKAADKATADKPAAKKKPAAKPKAETKAKAKPKPKEPAERPVVNASARFVRIAPRKARLVADQVRGLPLEDALPLLRFSTRGAAQDIRKLLESAAANAETNHDLVADELLIKDIHVDEGPTLRRYRPRALGRATRINKRTSHIAVALTPED